jgi:hypothetical protein
MRTALCVKFPDQQRKYRELRDFWPRSGLLGPEKSRRRRGFFRKFPAQWNREIRTRNRELFSGIREFIHTIRERLELAKYHPNPETPVERGPFFLFADLSSGDSVPSALACPSPAGHCPARRAPLTSAIRERRSHAAGVAALTLAADSGGNHHRQIGDGDLPASSRIPSLLALEVPPVQWTSLVNGEIRASI